MNLLVFALSVGLVNAYDAELPARKWQPIKDLLDGWEFMDNFAVSIGDTNGQQFVYEKGQFKMSKLIPTGSTSKWPSAMMVAGLVADGTIKSLDSKASDYFKWWTTDPKDLRSTVTLRMLLSFTSGFGDGNPGMEGNTRAARLWRKANGHPSRGVQITLNSSLHAAGGRKAADPCDTATGDILLCARSVYDNVALIGTPGQVYSYNSNHLNLAAAMACAASNLTIKEVISKYLLVPYNMKSSSYQGQCPDFGASLITNGNDYEQFLTNLLTYKTLPKEIIDASEVDSTPFMKDYYTLYGDYGFGHFLMCFDSTKGFTRACEQAQCHMDPGAFGFIPIIDRKNGYYMQVVSAEVSAKEYPLSGIPEYLAVALKPHVDAIMEPHPFINSADHAHYTPALLSLGIADVNYCLDCKLNPGNCQ